MNQHDDHAQRREQPEPTEGNRPIPRVVLMLVATLVLWGVGYIVSHTGYPLTGGDSRTPVNVAGGGGEASGSKSTAVSGERVYNNTCAACHQASGKGVPGSFPPLAGSNWVEGRAENVIAIVSQGLKGPIKVKGDTYNGSMPAFGAQLSNAELAAVISFVRSEWGNDASAINTGSVEELRAKHDGHGQWSADELRKAFGGPES
jgi:mono/diheme cytochrome c family protein